MINSDEFIDRAKGVFMLSAIGDALGAPVEIMRADEITRLHGRLTSFVERMDHKFGPVKAGETTDDTQLTLAIARSIARRRKIDVEDIAREHVEEFHKTTRGWGSSTKRAVERIASGISLTKAGSAPSDQDPKRGKGNGVAMKIAPIGLYCAANEISPIVASEARTAVRDVALMTHATAMGVAQALAHVSAIRFLLVRQTLKHSAFVGTLVRAAQIGEYAMPYERARDDDRLSERLSLLQGVNSKTTDLTLRNTLGNGRCYAYESLPLAYALFLRKPRSIEALYDAVNWGGDTDTLGAIVGSLLGAYNGTRFVPPDLWSKVDRREEIEEVAREFVVAMIE